ncbi:MAG: hypothetical protein KJO84_04585, partial [Acidimicrobiia bacterium]|nr:hypothetical protein [Acidimicrobiia bacterium]
LGTTIGTGTITNDDIADLVVTPATVDPVAEGAATTFDVSLATEPVGTVDVAISTTDPSITILPSSTVMFDSGSWSTPVTITLQTADDSLVKGDEAVTASLLAASISDPVYDLQSDSVPFTITDNDSASVRFATSGPTSSLEGTTVDIDVVLDVVTTPPGGSLAADVTPVIAFTDTTTTPSDYSDATLPGALTFASGSVDGETRQASVDLTLDGVSEATESFTVTLDSVSGPATIGAPAAHSVDIEDQDDPVFAFDFATSDDDEGTTALIGVRVDVPGGGPLPSDVTVDVAEALGSTAIAADRTFTDPTSILFSNGTLSGTVLSVSIPLLDDAIVEAPETLELELSIPGATGVLGTQTTHTLTINETQPVMVEFSVPTSMGAEGDALVDLEVALDAGGETLDIPVTVDVVIVGGTAEVIDHGFSSPDTATFTGTDTAVTLPILPATDTLIEGDETIFFQLQDPSAPAAIGPVADHTFTVLDLNSPATITIGSDATVLEDAVTAAVSITLNTGTDTLGEPVVLSIDGGVPGLPPALDPDDFGLDTPTVTFSAGSGDGTIASASISIVDDGVQEPTEEALFDVTALSGPVTGPFGSFSIFIDDNDPATVAFTEASGGGSEADLVATSLTLTVPGGGTLSDDVTVDFTQVGGTATAVTDYSISAVVVPAGTADGATIPISFTLADDLLVEGAETAEVELVYVSGPGTTSLATFDMSITDTDSATIVLISTAGPTLSEGATLNGVDVQLQIPGGATLASDAVATVTVTGGSAVSPDDFTFTPYEVTFASGSADLAFEGVPVTVDADTL